MPATLRMHDFVFRSIDETETDAVLDLLAEWYGDREFFARYFRFDPTFSADLCFVAEQDGRFVSTFQVFRKRLRWGTTSLDVAGVGNVFTTAAFRGHGIASRLLRFGLSQLPAHGFDLSLLFAVRISFYAQLEYRHHLRYLVYFEPGSAPPHRGDYEVRDFTPSDLPAVQSIYDEYSSRWAGTTLRDPAYWQGQLRYAGNPDESFLVARAGNQVVAYARATELLDFYVVMEHGYLPGHHRALVELLIEHYYRGTVTRPGLLAQVAIEPHVLAELRSRGLVDRRIEDQFWMWRVVDPQRLTAKLGLRPSELTDDNLWSRLWPPEASVYWISDRF